MRLNRSFPVHSADVLARRVIPRRSFRSPFLVLAAAKVAEQLGAKQVVIATPVGTQAAADRITARRYDFVCPSIVMDAQGHPAPYGDVAGETPERLRSIMIAHQAA